VIFSLSSLIVSTFSVSTMLQLELVLSSGIVSISPEKPLVSGLLKSEIHQITQNKTNFFIQIYYSIEN